jgi:hypothetical protein
MKQENLSFLLILFLTMVGSNVLANDNIVENEEEDIITFADNKVKTLCVAKWDTNGDNELSKSEAAAVTDIETVFQNQAEITNFSEFKYFIGVTSIGQYALSGCTKLSTIEFPSSLQSFDRYACYNSGFENIVFPDNVTSIGNSAFRNCTALSTIKLGKNSVSFGKNVFRSCSNLTSITFDGTECHFNGEDPFRDCNTLTAVVITDLSAWCKSSFAYPSSNPISKTKSLSLRTSDNNISVIKHLVIPVGITTINSYAFYLCESLKSVVIPSSVTSIGSFPFTGCENLISVTTDMTEPVTIISTTFPNRANMMLYVPFGSKDVYEATNYWKEFKEIVEMPSSLKDGDVFTAKTSEDIDMTFKVISASDKTCQVGNGNGTAAILTNYEGNVTIPSVVYGYSVIKISYRSFRRTDITSVVIPDGIESIDAEAFEQCYKLTSVVIPDGVKTIRDEAFKTCTALEHVEIAGSVQNIFSEVFKNCSKLQTVEFKDGIKALGSSMFEKCTNLTSVVLPNSIESIGWGTFNGCSSLSEITLPQGTSFIGSSAFWGCTALSFIEIPSAIKTIENSVFSGCTKLSSIVIPEGITTIGGGAFSGCTNLLSIDFPSTLESIGSQAFENTKWFESQPDGVVYIKKIAYCYKGTMSENTIITIAEGTIGVSPDAFRSLSNLVEVDIPASVTSIGSWCFNGCSNLKKVKILMTIPLAIDAGTFSNRENAFLYVPDGCVDIYLKANVWKEFLCIKQLSDPEMFSGGNGTESDPYLINTVGDVRVLAKNVNNGTSYQGIFFKVDKPEIDFSGVTPIPIGTITGINSTGGSPYYLGNAFIGTLDGNGVIIKNWSSNKGLLINIGKSGVVKDIIMDATCVITGTGNVGGIAGVSEGNILNCINRADISSTGYHIGGICGDNMGTISNCKNYGSITGETKQYDSSSGSMIGGIAGDTDGGQSGNLHNAVIRNCENYGTVTSSSFWVGGIVGFATDGLLTGMNGAVENCINKGNVIGSYSVGGIIGNVSSHMTIHNNFVTGCTITGTKGNSYGAGVISETCNQYFSNNFYSKDVILKVGDQTYDGSTPRGVWGGYDSSTSSYLPKDITENCGAILLTEGDINTDGQTTAQDASLVLQHVAGKTPLNDNVKKAADVNGDGEVTAQDASLILQKVAGKIDW